MPNIWIPYDPDASRPVSRLPHSTRALGGGLGLDEVPVAQRQRAGVVLRHMEENGSLRRRAIPYSSVNASRAAW
jgi:hypothetical protein